MSTFFFLGGWTPKNLFLGLSADRTRGLREKGIWGAPIFERLTGSEKGYFTEEGDTACENEFFFQAYFPIFLWWAPMPFGDPHFWAPN